MFGWTAASLETNGIHMHYLRTGGSKPAVVLLHGLAGGGACWEHLARALAEEYDVLMPDARGHGGSSAPRDGYRYEDHAADLAGLIEGLGLAAPVLLGHSMGGMTATLVASRAGRALGGLVLADPTFLSLEAQHAVHQGDAAAQHRRLLDTPKEVALAQARARHPHRSLELLDVLVEARRQTSPAAYEVLTPPSPEYRPLVGSIRVPTLLVIGGQGALVSAEEARALQAIHPQLAVEQLAEAGHGLVYDQPERFAAIVRSFLRPLAALRPDADG